MLLAILLMFGAILALFFVVIGNTFLNGGCRILGELTLGRWGMLQSGKIELNSSTLGILRSCYDASYPKSIYDSMLLTEGMKVQNNNIIDFMDGLHSYNLFMG